VVGPAQPTLAVSRALVPSFTKSSPLPEAVGVTPKRSPAPFRTKVTVVICRPCGVISMALPSLPFTAMRSPFGAEVRPKGPFSDPPVVRVFVPSITGVDRVEAMGMAVMELPMVSAT